jgi:hypothetical protein
MKQRAPALPDSPTFQQLWDALGSKLIEAAQERLLYTQEVRGSSPLPPTTELHQDSSLTAFTHHLTRDASPLPPILTTPPRSKSSTAHFSFTS